MYKKYLSNLLIITLVVFSVQIQIVQAAPVVDAIVTIGDFVINEVSLIVDAVAIVVLGYVGGWFDVGCAVFTGDVCGFAESWTNPFRTDLGCRNAIGLEGEVLIDCQNGGGNLPGSGNLSPVVNSLTTLAESASSPTCNQISLSGINAQGHNWALLRDGVIIKELLAADTGYTDTGLTPHTNYTYAVRLPYPAESGFKTTDSNPLVAYTKCLPQCGFGVDTSSIAEFSSTNLRWRCINNDPAIDVGSCRITDSTGSLSQAVNALSGSLSVSPKADTTYTLTCTNIDGPISVPQNISVFKPGIQEIKP